MYKLFVVNFFVVIATTLAACHAVPSTARQGGFNIYYIYTKDSPNRPTELDINSETKLKKQHDTAIIVHGHEGSAFSSLNPLVKDTFLASEEDVNLIVVDWSAFASMSYSHAVNAVFSVATELSNLITYLDNKDLIDINTLHLIGFDLGAHVVGVAGRSLDGKVARITGLDPAGRQWGSKSLRLRKSDALYVEILHTNNDILGYGIRDAIGDVDIYVNGGNAQPGCFLNNQCSHNRAWEIFAASVEHDHLMANYCGNQHQVSTNSCRGRPIPVGNNKHFKLGGGLYRVNTGRIYPY